MLGISLRDRIRNEVSSFCRDVCVKLQACPCLFGPDEHSDHCPNDCQRVDKSTFHQYTERRGRPKGSVNGRRKKKKAAPEKKEKEQQPSQETESNKDVESVESEHSAGSAPPSSPGTRRV
ncbi:scm-like with four MBT domains protein 1 [Helicoverpa armigera]|uniref:scm-like with four MBT domains protein 1 n=1 Tax=Helicoverpa armigera TaxID=29058 RepID=UPI003083341D